MPRTPLLPILATLAIFFALLGAYVGGYFWLGEVIEWRQRLRDGHPFGSCGIERKYPSQWLRAIYVPAGKVEAWVRGIWVNIGYPAPDYRPTYESPED